jgi:hypothetical protein
MAEAFPRRSQANAVDVVSRVGIAPERRSRRLKPECLRITRTPDCVRVSFVRTCLGSTIVGGQMDLRTITRPPRTARSVLLVAGPRKSYPPKPFQWRHLRAPSDVKPDLNPRFYTIVRFSAVDSMCQRWPTGAAGSRVPTPIGNGHQPPRGRSARRVRRSALRRNPWRGSRPAWRISRWRVQK